MTIQVAASNGLTLPAGPTSTYGAGVWSGSQVNFDQFGMIDICSEFGVSTALADNSTAINNALSTLGPLGLKAYLKASASPYKIQNPVVIGNGSSSGFSTWSAALIGGGFAPATTYGTAGNLPGATLQWNGSSGAANMVQIVGPVVGWELSNLTLDGQNNASSPTWALKVISGQRGYSHRLNVKGCINGIQENTVASASIQSLSFHNTYINTGVTWNGSAGSNYGLQFDAGIVGTNACYTEFHNLEMLPPNTSLGGTRYFIGFRSCDNIRIFGLHLFGGATGSDAIHSCVFDYGGVTSSQPNDCLIQAADLVTYTAVNVGTPGLAAPNRIVAISAGNGSSSNPALTNLDWGYSNAAP